jgi:hypothetical protein
MLGGCMNPVKNNDSTNINNNIWPLPKLDPLVEKQIKQDWYQYWLEELSLLIYYGTHNGYVAFIVSSGDLVVTNFILAGTIFRHDIDFTIYLWKDGTFHDMINAYLLGILSAADIKILGYIHKRMRYGNCSSVDEWYYNTDDIYTTIP